MAALKDAFDSLAKDRENLQAAEEAALKAKRDAERHVAKLQVETQHRSASSGSREAELQEEVDKCMVSMAYRRWHTGRLTSYVSQSILKCSTCKQNMRNTVITKCMHCQSAHLYVFSSD